MRFARILPLILIILLLTGCGAPAGEQTAAVAATTAPVAQFAQAIAEGTGIQVDQVITDSVSCLHDYSLSVRQMRTLEASTLVLTSGQGLEAFMADALDGKTVIDCSQGADLIDGDPHYWLDPDCARVMAGNIFEALSAQFPDHREAFLRNREALDTRLSDLKQSGQGALEALSTRKIITFHDGFAYFARAFELEIISSIEEKSGSEASAADLMDAIALVEQHALPAVFTERNGSSAAAEVIRAETGVEILVLDTAMGGTDYFEAMEHNFSAILDGLS